VRIGNKKKSMSNKLGFEYTDHSAIDTLTGEIVSRSISIESGMRVINIGIGTVKQMVEFLKSKDIDIYEESK
jgi:hypothetical protein